MAQFTEQEARMVIERANEHVERELYARMMEMEANDDADKELYAERAKIESAVSAAIIDLFEDLQGPGGEYYSVWRHNESKWMLYKKVI